MGLSIVNTLTSEDRVIFSFIDNKTSISNSSSHNGFICTLQLWFTRFKPSSNTKILLKNNGLVYPKILDRNPFFSFF